MKICFIAPANNYHTAKWCNWFSGRGHTIHVISFVPGEIENATVHYINPGVGTQENYGKKIKYLLQFKKVKKIVEEIHPDIINVHYATSYGTVAAIAKLDNYILSVWGADVYDFPKKGFLYKRMLCYSLKRATTLFSTSKAMAKEAAQYTDKKFEITPFGVDMEMFSPKKRRNKQTIEGDVDFTIGTIKALTPKYGIDYLLKAAAIVKEVEPNITLKVRIGGKGPNELEYKELAQSLGIGDIVTWLGFIPQEQVAKEWANMDVGIVYSSSSSESFGVSAVEAEASGIPVIISDVPGLMEATSPGLTSIVVGRMNENALADAIMLLYHDPDLRKRMGAEGRKFANDHYELNKCFEKVERTFKSICKNGNN